MAYEYEEALSREVPTHLFKFEDKIFGLTVTQLLTDSLAASGLWYLWGLGLPLPLRITACVLAVIAIIVLVHMKFKGRSLLDWATYALFFYLTPPKTIWYSAATAKAMENKKQKPKYPSVQDTWMRLSNIENGYMSFVGSSPSKKEKNPKTVRYTAVVEVIGVNLQLLAEREQVRIFDAYEGFLAGLEFPLQIISVNDAIDVQAYEPLLAHEQNLSLLRGKPRLEALARSHLQFLRKKLGTCVVTRHYVIIHATPVEETVNSISGKSKNNSALFSFLPWGKKEQGADEEQVLQQLRLRLRVINDGFKEIGLQTRRLDDEALAQFYAACLVPGVKFERGHQYANAHRTLVMSEKKK